MVVSIDELLQKIHRIAVPVTKTAPPELRSSEPKDDGPDDDPLYAIYRRLRNGRNWMLLARH
jgi:hypothetical protein